MTVTNVSTYGSLQTLLQNMSQDQNALNTDQEQISSGQVSQTFDGLSGSVEQFTSLNAQVARLQDYQQNNSTYISQLNTTNTVLGQIQTLATQTQSLIGTMSGQLTPANSGTFVQQLQSNLAQLVSSLNTSYAGNYLFSGAKTNTAPVITPVPVSVDTSSTPPTPNNSYYQGSTQTSTVRVSDDQEIDNNITAANPAFQDIIGGIQAAIQVAQTGSGSGAGGAETLVSNGVNGVIALAATVQANVVTVQSVNTQSQTVQAYAQSLAESMSQSDVTALSVKVAQDQTTLEATYETYSRISSLTLASYLQNP